LPEGGLIEPRLHRVEHLIELLLVLRLEKELYLLWQGLVHH
jgi:hypothetical protein